ncbi:oxidoreductase, partial [Candidatus Aerophobetes bacterium]
EVGQNMLEKLGYRVLAASNAKEALQIFNSHQGEISLVITDMVMPNMSGGDLYRELNRISPGVKVLLVSGYSLGDEIKKLKAEGVIDYLQKPFQLEVLARKVYEALSVK